MLSMVKSVLSFLDWLRPIMEEKKIKPADIARTKIVSGSAVSLLFSMKTKSVSIEMCQAISQATGISLLTVYEAAGIPMPKLNTNDPDTEQMNHLYRGLKKDSSRKRAIKLLEVLVKEETDDERRK